MENPWALVVVEYVWNEIPPNNSFIERTNVIIRVDWGEVRMDV